MSNFTYLSPEWPGLHQKATRAESRARTEPVSSLQYSRLALEEAVNEVYELEYLEYPYGETLYDLMAGRAFEKTVPIGIRNGLHLIRKYGNTAAHYGGRVTFNEAITSLRYLHAFLKWFAVKYSKATPEVPGPFSDKPIPREDGSATLTKLRAELKRVQQQKDELEAAQAKEREARRVEQEAARADTAERDKLETKIAAQRAQVAARSRFRDIPDASEFTESETRGHLIDAALKEVGWINLRDGIDTEFRVENMPVSRQSKSGKGYVDYVLWGDDGKPLAIIEAKRTSKSPETGRHQATLYATALEERFGQRPVIFYSNGYEHYLLDDTFYSAPRQVSGFFSKDTLQWRIQQRTGRKEIRGLTPNPEIAGRYYQIEAIQRVAESFLAPTTSLAPAAAPEETLRGNKRRALLVMATGSGKTRTAAALTELLGKHGWARRVLFLADRNALVTQAKEAFAEHLPTYSAIDLTREKETDGTRLVFSTYPTMLHRIEANLAAAAGAKKGTEERGEETVYGPGYFDLIITDEAHRSLYNRYQAIFHHFDALVLGLTATPKGHIHRNTYEQFDCPSGDPTFEYPLDKGVDDGHLVPYRNRNASTELTREGIRYDELSEEEKEHFEESFTDSVTGERPDAISSSDLNKRIFNEDTVDKVLHELMTNGLRIEGGDKLGRTIIFAVNKRHAKYITERFQKRYPELPEDFIKTVHYGVSHADTIIKTFCDHHAEKPPQIAVSVDMMDTGVDAPRVLNLVFFKPVRSSAKFWQMIGRGTRLSPGVFGPGADKTEFLIFDVCQNFEFFSAQKKEREPNPTAALSERIFTARLTLSQLLFRTGDAEQAAAGVHLLDGLFEQVDHLRSEAGQRSYRVRAARRHLDRFAKREDWNQLSEDDLRTLSMEIAPLVPPSPDDESARRFDLLMLQLRIAQLRENPEEEADLHGKLLGIAGSLSLKFNIPDVQAQSSLIRDMRDPNYYGDRDTNDFEDIRLRLRDLIKYLKQEQQKPIFTRFQDVAPTGVAGEPISNAGSVLYQQRVEKYLRENKTNIVIRKIRTRQPITEAELGMLNGMLLAGPLEGQQTFTDVFPERDLKDFVLELLGMDKAAAQAHFAEFLAEGKYSAAQTKFIDQIITALEKNGRIDPGQLYEAPFTNMHDDGLDGVFPDRAMRVIDLVRRVG